MQRNEDQSSSTSANGGRPRASATPEQRFGQAVQTFRAGQEMSQRDFAAKLTERGMSVDASAVSRIEKGARSVRLVEALTIAEVLQVDLDLLVSGSKSPSQELQSLRRQADHALHELAMPIASVFFTLWETKELLERHPELFKELKDDDLGSPRSAAEYYSWVTKRMLRWSLSLEEVIVADSEEEAEQYINLITEAARMRVVVGEEAWEEMFGGLDQEEA